MPEQRFTEPDSRTPRTPGYPPTPQSDVLSPRDRLWHRIRQGQLVGLRFLPNHKIAGTVVDFFCFDARLAIVCTAREGEADPRERMEALFAMGIKTLRFTPAELEKRMGYVLETIAEVASVQLSRRPARTRRSVVMRE